MNINSLDFYYRYKGAMRLWSWAVEFEFPMKPAALLFFCNWLSSYFLRPTSFNAERQQVQWMIKTFDGY